MKVVYSTTCGLILSRGEPDGEPGILHVDSASSNSATDSASLISLISDWEEMEVETLEVAQKEVRKKYWRHWATRLVAELIIGLPTTLQRDTILYLESLLTSRAEPEEVMGDLLQAPLANPERVRRLVSIASFLGCAEVATILRTIIELQPRLVAFLHVWRNLPVEHFGALGLPREELWRQLVANGWHKSCIVAVGINEFINVWLRYVITSLGESLASSIRKSLRSLGEELAGQFYKELATAIQTENQPPHRDEEIDPLMREEISSLMRDQYSLVFGPTDKMWFYYQKRYEYSYQGTIWDGIIRFSRHSYPPPATVATSEPARPFESDVEVLLSPMPS